MAKVTLPDDLFKNTKRIGERVLLKNRREGFTITFQALTKKMVFFDEEQGDFIKTEIQGRWNGLSPTEKIEWGQLGEGVYMDGETLYKQQEKKSMTTGFCNLATCGMTKVNGVLETEP